MGRNDIFATGFPLAHRTRFLESSVEAAISNHARQPRTPLHTSLRKGHHAGVGGAFHPCHVLKAAQKRTTKTACQMMRLARVPRSAAKPINPSNASDRKATSLGPLAADPLGRENCEFSQSEKFLLREDRTFVKCVSAPHDARAATCSAPKATAHQRDHCLSARFSCDMSWLRALPEMASVA